MHDLTAATERTEAQRQDTANRAELDALAIVEDVWRIVAATPATARELGTLVTLPDIGHEAIARRSAEGQALLRRIAAVDVTALTRPTALALATARTRAECWSREADWYWLAFDPLGAGFFSMFAPSAYSGAFVLNTVHESLASTVIDDADDLERHLERIADYAQLVGQLTERTAGQAVRDIRLPAPQLERAIALMSGLRGVAASALRDVATRGQRALSAHDLERVDRRIESELDPAFDEMLGLLGSADYESRAPATVGLSAYPGGSDIYAELVRIHTTLDLSPEQIHRRGHERMERIENDMRALLDAEGFAGTPAAYRASLADDPAWRGTTPDEIAAHFQRAIDRLEPEVDTYFGGRPKAPYGVAPLPDALSGSMTFGYYSPPQPDRDTGLYLFNVSNLAKTPLPMIAALNYHELVPGHHFHIAAQSERTDLHPLRQYAGDTAFAEGWAEYAARFAGEIGMYQAPQERFGRLMMDAFLTSRLVVDTGMNAFGWSLERARSYMDEHAFMDRKEIESETLRYSCDIPGQALAYKLGDDFLYDLREDLRASLGDAFSISAFHDAVLRAGGLSLPLVASEVRAELGA